MKHKYVDVKNRFGSCGYTLISKEYKNNRTKLHLICPEGHDYYSSYTNFFSRQRRCRVCSNINLGNIKRLSLGVVSNTFKKEGYTLLTKEYKNVDQKLDFICNKGHNYSMSYHNFKTGWRCVKCRGERHSNLFSGSGHPNWKGGISDQGYCPIWKDKEYKESIKERDNYICRNPTCYRQDKVLHIHHIDYNKQNCCPNNLITVCRSCNARANFDREWHEEFYKIINNKVN